MPSLKVQCLAQYLEHGKHSITVCCMNGWNMLTAKDILTLGASAKNGMGDNSFLQYCPPLLCSVLKIKRSHMPCPKSDLGHFRMSVQYPAATGKGFISNLPSRLTHCSSPTLKDTQVAGWSRDRWRSHMLVAITTMMKLTVNLTECLPRTWHCAWRLCDSFYLTLMTTL